MSIKKMIRISSDKGFEILGQKHITYNGLTLVGEDIQIIDGVDSNTLPLTVKECQVIYRIMAHHYIPYEDREAHAVINKIIAHVGR